MDKDTRNTIERATQRARRLLEEDFAAQLEGDFDVHRTGSMAVKAGSHLSVRQAFQREKIVVAIEHKRAAGMDAPGAVADYLRDAAFTTLNRFVALKMLEARELVQECITKGEQSSGYREFCGLAAGLQLLPQTAGYRLYIESLFDELSTEVKVLFDRRDPSSVLWPKRATFEQLLEILNASELARMWGEDETIGWVYQFFNDSEERKKMRDPKQGGSQAPRNSRELAVRNQFFTPRYIVQFLTDNTLGRIWYEMRGTKTVLAEKCEYMVSKPEEAFAPRAKKDPRDLRVLDPACGSGHFLLYAFDLLLVVYEEAHADAESPPSEVTGNTLAEDYPSVDALREAVPGLVLAHNLHGVDIDPRCAQIAQLALWMRAQKAYRSFCIARGQRPKIRRSNIVVAEPLVADEQIAKEFVAKLGDVELGRVFTSLVESLSLAGDLGLLLRIEKLVKAPAQAQLNWLAPPEERIRAALEQFALEEATATNTRRRLFADDTTQAIGLLAVSELKFDAVLMNPPFGEPTGRASTVLEKYYPSSRHDLAASFVDAALAYLAKGGLVGALTTRTIFLLAQSTRFRADVLGAGDRIRVAADLGYGVLDATVETAAYVVSSESNREGYWIRLVNHTHKEDLLRAPGAALRIVPATLFKSLPNTPFLYWMPSRILDAFTNGKPFESEQRCVRCGMGTLDDFRFVRCWWEVASQRLHQSAPSILRGKPWVAYAKGGEASPYVIEMPLVVNFGAEGRELKAFVTDRVGSPSRKIQAERFYRRPGIQFGRRVRMFSPAALPAEAIFSDSANAVFVANDDEDELFSYLGLLNGEVTRAIFSAFAPVRKMEVGYLQRMPVPDLSTGDAELNGLARAQARVASQRQLLSEVSRYFLRPGLEVTAPGAVSEVDRVALERYGLEQEDVAALTSASETLSREAVPAEESVNDDTPDEEGTIDSNADALNSWLIGVAFGRFDPRLATGERAIPPGPEPFDPLPSRSPGMWPEGEEPADPSDILVDDEGHADDLVSRALAVAERSHIDVPENLRAWLAKSFFPLHIKMYSKSRRKAPIYWQLATPSANYSVWLYIHAFSRDTLFRVQNDYVAPKLAHEERRLESLASELRDGATTNQRKEMAAQQNVVEELRAFLEEVKRVAPLWNPNCDDGVAINFAPLFRLVPHHKPWQKELKSTWDALCDGKYDWAQLAMHLWPERVVPNCAKDRSLAIAHGLEDVFWVGIDGKWIARKGPTHRIDELVHERSSLAVKSSLRSLLEAPSAVGAGRNTRKGKANA